MTRYYKLIGLVVIAFGVNNIVSHGQTSLSKIVISNGGNKMGSTNYSAHLTLGQSLVAKSKVTNTEACVGFWYVPLAMSTATIEIYRNHVVNGVPSLNTYPNPFRANANIEFETIKKGVVKLFIVDMQGKYVKSILDQYLPAGKYKLALNGELLGEGVYSIVLWTDDIRLQNKCMVLK